jgi:3-phenylpropionate/trans-cinnamate dioxygenase ferredoxin subunit
MSEFKKVATTSEIPKGEMRSFRVRHDQVVIAHTDDGFYAFADECTHDSGPIYEGQIKDHQVVCPRHGARFNIVTGAVEAPPAVVGIDTYEVKVDGDDILVKFD